MSHRVHQALQRALSLCAAAVLTIAILGGIDQLSQSEAAAPQWAQQNAVQA